MDSWWRNSWNCQWKDGLLIFFRYFSKFHACKKNVHFLLKKKQFKPKHLHICDLRSDRKKCNAHYGVTDRSITKCNVYYEMTVQSLKKLNWIRWKNWRTNLFFFKKNWENPENKWKFPKKLFIVHSRQLKNK